MKFLKEQLNNETEEKLEEFIRQATNSFNVFYCVESIPKGYEKSVWNEKIKYFNTLSDAKEYYNKEKNQLKDDLDGTNEFAEIVLSKVNVDLNFDELKDEYINMDNENFKRN